MIARRFLPALFLSLSFLPASGQTPLEFDAGYPDPLPPGVAAGPGAAAADAPGAPDGLPVPESAVEQADRQREGDFGPMLRPGLPGGQIQEAFSYSESSAGVHDFLRCDGCVYKVRTRELMITTLVLPEPVATVDLGDPAGFAAQLRGETMVALRPNGAGLDTSVTVHGSAGGLYAFYVRSEGFNSRNVPDLVVRVRDPSLFAGLDTAGPGDGETVDDRERSVGAPGVGADAGDAGVSSLAARAGRELRAGGGGERDFVETVAFDPGKLHGWSDYRLWGDEDLAPEVVFRDDRFTYLQYGPLWAGLDLPTAYVVVDDVDELVNTRVRGRTYIVESTARLISLKSGSRFLCIEYAPDEAALAGAGRP